MIRCAWFLTDLVGGGAERLPLILAPTFERSELTLVLLKDRVEHRIPPDGPKPVTLSSSRRSLAATGPVVLARCVRLARDYDLLVAGLEWAPTFFTTAAGMLARRPVVATVHVDLQRYQQYEPVPNGWRRAMASSLRRAAAVVAVSDDVKDSLVALGIEEKRICVIPNPVPILNAAGATHPGPPRIVTVASLKRIKGIDVALEAAARLADIDFRWEIVGDGPERETLHRRAEELGLGERIAFLGFQPDPQPHFRKADLYVLPSRVEGAPLVLAEALAAGLPIVATACGHGVESLVDDRVGALVPTEDADTLARKIRSLLADPERRKTMGEVARQRALRLAPKVAAERYEAVFASVASEWNRRGRREE